MLQLKDGGKYVRRDGAVVEVTRRVGDSSYPTHPFIEKGGLHIYAESGKYNWLDKPDHRFDLVSECPPPFTIAAGNYYRTRDGRKAYVACGPVTMPDDYEWPHVYYGQVKFDSDEVEANTWDQSGSWCIAGTGEDRHDLVAPWHPTTLTDPATGKTYRVAEEVT